MHTRTLVFGDGSHHDGQGRFAVGVADDKGRTKVAEDLPIAERNDTEKERSERLIGRTLSLARWFFFRQPDLLLSLSLSLPLTNFSSLAFLCLILGDLPL